MLPDRLGFLGRFDSFYQVIVNSVKENKINERDFYSIIRAKCKAMDRGRLESYRKKIAERIHKEEKKGTIKSY